MARQPVRPGARRWTRPARWVRPARWLRSARWRWTRPGGLRRRLVVAFVLVAAVSAGGLAASSYLLVRQARLEGSLTTSTVQAREDLDLAAAISYPEAADFVQAYEQRGSHAVLIFPGGRSVVSNAQVNPAIPVALRSLVRQGQLGYQRMDIAGLPYLVLAGQVPESAAELYLFFPEQNIEHNLAQLRTALALAWLGVLLVAALTGRALARRTLEPVAQASQAARAIADGRLDTRLPAGAGDEFGSWAAAFNEMADALEAKIAALSAAQARELRFTANVAHELRTPLSALVAGASLLRDQVGDLPDPARRPVELLVDVRALVSAIVGARGWDGRVAVRGDPLTLATDPRLLERILANLMGNAVEHSGREVTVRISADGYAEVADAGPGIPPEHLPHVFERFYKADSARTSAGSGLGLAIARENARLLGGFIEVSSDVARGSVFRLTLPSGPAGDVSEL